MGACASLLCGGSAEEGPGGARLRRNNSARLLLDNGAPHKQLTTVFNTFVRVDRNNNCKLDKKEFARLFKIDAANSLYPRLWSLFDRNDDQVIGLREFVHTLAKFLPDRKSHGAKHGANGAIQFAFKLFDTDGSGYIERGELRSLLRSASGSHAGLAMDGRIAKVLREVDQNGDNRVDQLEFVSLARRYPMMVQPAMHLWEKIQRLVEPSYVVMQHVRDAGAHDAVFGELAESANGVRKARLSEVHGSLSGMRSDENSALGFLIGGGGNNNRRLSPPPPLPPRRSSRSSSSRSRSRGCPCQR
mmetsp:Transcript_10317/g.33821  ORF Transcript_10317/g.33821 Transcript_10317/m.33821 type:complete len:302 (+) Transcript_10317:41-946(+)